MGWKNLKPWLKGGIIGAGLYLLSMIFLFSEKSIIIYLSYPAVLIFFLLTGESGAIYVFIPFIIGSVVFYFIIGAIIGWIIGKIKSKREREK